MSTTYPVLFDTRPHRPGFLTPRRYLKEYRPGVVGVCVGR